MTFAGAGALIWPELRLPAKCCHTAPEERSRKFAVQDPLRTFTRLVIIAAESSGLAKRRFSYGSPH